MTAKKSFLEKVKSGYARYLGKKLLMADADMTLRDFCNFENNLN